MIPKVTMRGSRGSQVFPKGHPKVQFRTFGPDLGGIWTPKWPPEVDKKNVVYDITMKSYNMDRCLQVLQEVRQLLHELLV